MKAVESFRSEVKITSMKKANIESKQKMKYNRKEREDNTHR
jgi:hypothetical protein